MGRSNNTELVNPASRFFDWSGSTGTVVYYDKDKGENIEVDMPFNFLVLEAVSQITGGIDNGSKYEGFWSNAVMNTKTQPFTVRSASGVVAQGLYEQIKGTPGIKYMRGLYVMFFDEDTPLEVIKRCQPDVLVKGGDYQIENIVGHDIVKEVYTVPVVEGLSTTAILQKGQ